MANKQLFTKYKGYEIKQIGLSQYVYKNGDMYVSKEGYLPKKTKKQLYRYLRYLVNNEKLNIVPKPRFMHVRPVDEDIYDDTLLEEDI